MAAVAVCCLSAKVYDWLRLFDKTAFYVRLIEQTLGDISDFFVLFAVALFMFGMPLQMLSY